MKKVLIIAAIAAGAYFLLGKKTDDTATAELPANDTDFFTKYNNKLVVDSVGYWILVKDGKLFTPIDMASLQEWRMENPKNAVEIRLDFPVWEIYNQTKYGGTF